ncbi:MAG TPA: hypothetical protein VKP30_02520 [Polyangiaceae bacterium]|nr:hypothetical protein [Polyangiaceae bacterium]
MTSMRRTATVHGSLGASLAVALFVSWGCGGSDDEARDLPPPGPPPAEIDPARMLNALTAPEKGELCDWQASQIGGYGSSPTCKDGSPVTVAKSQNACIQAMPTSASCDATVQDLIDCIYRVATEPCQSTLFMSDECDPLVSCAL